MRLPVIETEFWDKLNAVVGDENYSKIVVLVDSHTLKHCLSDFSVHFRYQFEVIEIEPGERSKDLSICAHIWAELTEQFFDRQSLLINLGGGVVTDIGGFIAGIYKRGIAFINIPTSLLAMVDASIGGKCGIDFNFYKNHLGLFNEPKAIFISTRWLTTLPEIELKNGFAEMLKHGLIASKTHFEELIHLNDLRLLTQKHIEASIQIKTTIVSQDLKEKGIRKHLNFGHSVGHALESVFLKKNQNLLHGIAVAAGIVIESYISNKKSLLSDKELSVLENCIDKMYERLPYSKQDIPQIISMIKMDKKNENEKIQMALISSIGSCSSSVEVNNEEIEMALKKYAGA